MNIQIRAAVTVSSATLVVDAALYAVAVGSLLSAGPNPVGYDWLAVANHFAAVVALFVAVTGVLLAAEGRRITAWLVLAAVVTLGSDIGLRVGGLALANANQQSPDLNSLFLALIGTGSDLMVVPVVLASAAVVTFLVRRARRGVRAVSRAA